MFFWYSMTGGREQWSLATSQQRYEIATRVKPMYMTALDANEALGTDPKPTLDEKLKVKYSGPLYFDWDAKDDFQQTIDDFQASLKELEDKHQFDLRQARLYATGGRGFHMEVPMACLMNKLPPSGVTLLPYIYRDLAMGLLPANIAPTLDRGIYSIGQGRQWRQCNVKRPNGKYKVPISVDEARTMTVELYDELCSSPRLYTGREVDLPDAPWLIDPKGEVQAPDAPTVNLSLQAKFESHRSRLPGWVSRRRRIKDDRQAITKFDGQVPLGAKELFNGQHLSSEAGFNSISMQLAVLGRELGMNEDEFVKACEGFIKTHDGDSSRYSTPRRREDGLRERWYSMRDDVAYPFTLGALRSVCDPKSLPADLFESLVKVSKREVTIELPESGRVEVARVLTEEQAETLSKGGPSAAAQLEVSVVGVHNDKEGKSELTTLAIANTCIVREIETGDPLGIACQVGVVRSGHEEVVFRDTVIPMTAFTSRSNLDKTFATYDSFFVGSDVEAALLRQNLVDSALRRGARRYAVQREGVAILLPPGEAGEGELAWVTKDRVITAADLQPAGEGPTDEGGPSYTFVSTYNPNQDLRLDIHRLSPPSASDESFKTFMRHLLAFNSKRTIGWLLGWHVSCFHRELHHRAHKEFPILWVFGAAGSGKSKSMSVFYRMFRTEPEEGWNQLQGGMATKFSWRALRTQSTTIPTVIDEFKQVSFRGFEYKELLAEIRGAYDRAVVTRGGNRSGRANSSFSEIVTFPCTSPIAVLSEAYTDETAMQGRAIPVAFSPDDRYVESWRAVNHRSNQGHMPSLGSLLLRRTLMLGLSGFDAAWQAAQEETIERLPDQEPRVQNGCAVIVQGLDFLADSLREAGIDFRDEINELREEVFHSAVAQLKLTPVTSEAVKALDDISRLSRDVEATHPSAIREGHEYIFTNDGKMHMDMKAVGYRYRATAPDHGMPLYYDSPEVMITGLARMPAVVDDDCVSSPLYTHKGARIFSFDLRVLAEERVAPFKGQPDF